jgi:hypothetical protein
VLSDEPEVPLPPDAVDDAPEPEPAAESAVEAVDCVVDEVSLLLSSPDEGSPPAWAAVPIATIDPASI